MTKKETKKPKLKRNTLAIKWKAKLGCINNHRAEEHQLIIKYFRMLMIAMG